MRPISLFSTIGKLLKENILKIIQRHVEERILRNASQFDFRAHMTLQCMRLTDHVTLNSNNNTFTAAVFLNIEEAFDKPERRSCSQKAASTSK
jgi:hypothetical protein